FGDQEKPGDAFTGLLVDLIERVAQNLARDEPWYVTEFARATFGAAIIDLIAELSQFGGTVASSPQSNLQSRYGQDAKPQTIGPIIAHAVFVEHAQDVLRREFAPDQ